jgi:hypothetical protein
MPTEANSPVGTHVLDLFSMAGFEVIIYGRFWVIAKGPRIDTSCGYT